MTETNATGAQLAMTLPPPADPGPLVTFASPEAMPTEDLTAITVRRRDNDERLTFHGRAAWALGQLIRAGREGCTPITHPGPRWSHYVWLLKRDGELDIETIHEGHSGPWKGHHGRYVLKTPIEVLEIEEAEART